MKFCISFFSFTQIIVMITEILIFNRRTWKQYCVSWQAAKHKKKIIFFELLIFCAVWNCILQENQEFDTCCMKMTKLKTPLDQVHTFAELICVYDMSRPCRESRNRDKYFLSVRWLLSISYQRDYHRMLRLYAVKWLGKYHCRVTFL